MKALALLLLLWVGNVHAELRPFLPGSLQQIQAEQAGKPFILALWSATCIHCPGELKALAELARRHPRLDIVPLATDTPDDATQLASLARGYGLGQKPPWVFADPQPEKLRFEIDRRWYGELPRTYFFDSAHRRTGRSGVIPAAQLEQWVSEHVK